MLCNLRTRFDINSICSCFNFRYINTLCNIINIDFNPKKNLSYLANSANGTYYYSLVNELIAEEKKNSLYEFKKINVLNTKTNHSFEIEHYYISGWVDYGVLSPDMKKLFLEFIDDIYINEFNFESYIKIRMPTKDYSNFIPKIKYKA